ncbi:MAG: hypothetical protein IKA47_12460 [Oscillospiraceae bacterium]|nr:hypothetical protein [Oscillospiraceae bacterium]
MAKNENGQANENTQAAENAELEQLKALLAEKEQQVAEATARAEAAEKKNADAEVQLKALQDKNAKKAAAAKADTVRIKLPLEKNGPKDDQQVFINGRQYIIKRGVEVDVPRGVAEILRNREKMLDVVTAFDAANVKE